MRSIAKVFGRSPFVPLQTHMEKVAECVGLVPGILAAYFEGRSPLVAELADQLSTLEHEADVIKDDIRNSLPRGLFLPVDRGHLLTILLHQDALANLAENVGVLLTLKQAATYPGLRELIEGFAGKCIEAFEQARLIIGELDELLETGFGGAEATKVKEMIDRVSRLEFEADRMQHDVVKGLLSHEEELSYGDFFLWARVSRQIGHLADRSDNLAAAVRRAIETR